MKIESYSFGQMVIDGKAYTSDLIIYPERIDACWWRKEGHTLDLQDLKDILQANPDILIIGTGHDEMMRVPEMLRNILLNNGIDLRIAGTARAVEMFNSHAGPRRVIAAFHLTC